MNSFDDLDGARKLHQNAPEPGTVVRGRSWCKPEAKKRTLKVLERWPPDLKEGSRSPKRGRPLKRLQEPAKSRENRGGKESPLMKWLKKERTGLETQNTSLGPCEGRNSSQKFNTVSESPGSHS